MSTRELPRARGSDAVRLLRFLTRIVKLVPALLAQIESGHVESGQKVGQRRLSDGRTVELWLVAKAPRRDATPLLRGGD